jgi:hypothetical protein
MPKTTAAIFFAAVSVVVLTVPSAALPAGAQEAKPKIVRSKPAQPLEIDGVPCTAGYVFREEGSGRLHQCRLDRDAVVRNADLKKGTTVALNPDGGIRFVFLPGTTMVGEHSCRGGGHDWMTHFHPNGELRLCWLSRDEVVQGVPCSRATFWGEFFGGKYATTEFHDNGALSSCVASAATVVAGRHYEASERVKLDREGRPSR